MKNKVFSSLFTVLSLAILFTACKKGDSKDNPSEDVQVAAHTDDEAQVSTELDGIATDANTVVEYDPNFSGNNSVVEEIVCDASVAYDKDSDPKTITITYNGSNCGFGRKRTGKVILSMPKVQEWKNPGATITVTFENLKVTRNSDSKSVTINGSQTYVNESGGLMVQLPTLQSIIHTISSSDLSLKFDNGTTRTWNVSRKRVFNYDNGVVLTITGTHAEGNDTNIAEWGTNRFGNTFSTSITTPLVIRQDCNFRVTNGEVKHSTAAHTATVTFGLDATGTATVCPGTGTYFYKLVWTGPNGNSLNLVLPY